MTFDYASLASDASEMLEEFGQAITVTRPGTGGAYDPETGTVTGGTAQTFPGFGVVLDYQQREIDGTLIQQGDRRVYIAPDIGVTPKTGDTVTLMDGAVVRVMASRPLAPAGVVVLLDVQVRA